MTVRWPSTLFVLGFLALAETGTAQAQACEPRTFETSDYIVCSVDPKKSELRLFLNDVNGKPYRSFSRLASAVENGGEKLVFALNAGMYSDAFSPVGLHVEAGREVQALNTKTIEGPPASVPNFYKKPNGVFFFGEGQRRDRYFGRLCLRRGGATGFRDAVRTDAGDRQHASSGFHSRIEGPDAAQRGRHLRRRACPVCDQRERRELP